MGVKITLFIWGRMEETCMYCLFHSIQVSNIRVNSNAILVLKFINHGISEFSFPTKSRSIFLWFPECCANSFLYMSYTFFLDNLNSICRINIVDLIVTFAVTSEYKSVYWSLRVTTDCLKIWSAPSDSKTWPVSIDMMIMEPFCQ